MEILFIFFFGVVFSIIIYPILASISDIVTSLFELAKSFINLHIAKNNIELSKIEDSLEPTSSHVIGFQYNPEDDEEEYGE